MGLLPRKESGSCAGCGGKASSLGREGSTRRPQLGEAGVGWHQGGRGGYLRRNGPGAGGSPPGAAGRGAPAPPRQPVSARAQPPGQRPPPSAGSRSRPEIKTPPAGSGSGSGGRGRAAPRAGLTCRRLLAGGPAGRARWHHTAAQSQRCRCPLLRQPRRRQRPAAVPVLPHPHGERRSPAALRAGRADSAGRSAPHAATIALLPALRRASLRPTAPSPPPPAGGRPSRGPPPHVTGPAADLPQPIGW